MRIHRYFVTTVVAATMNITLVASSSKLEMLAEDGGGGRQRSPDFEDGEDTDDESTCGLYLATSSTSEEDEHRWGVYAGKDIESDSPIGYGDVAIHTFHLMANNIWIDPETTEIMDDLDKNELANIVDWFEQYVWVPHSSGGQFELKDVDNGAKIVTAVPGIGVVGGYNPKMTNADWNHSSAYHREAWNEYPEEAHPGRGAYTNYFNLELASKEIIPAGREIFVEYGDNWEDENGEKEKESLTKKDYGRVDQTIERMIKFFDKHESKLDESSKKKIYEFLRHDVMLAAAGSVKGKQIHGMLPDEPAELKNILNEGGSFSLRAPGSVRSMEWLEKNGLCMDNIKPGPSEIPYAGRGAFARRYIKKGSLVAPIPLIQISNESVLDLHPVKSSEYINDHDGKTESMYIRRGDERIGIQLLMNYCFGHPESSMLFFPTGAVTSYINHAQEDKVNAKMVWSDHPNNHNDWLDEVLKPFNKMGGLVLEIVATKDIKEGEEVLIDYGDEWQDAWDNHVREWNANKEDSWPLRALDLNQIHKKKAYRTKFEEPYPDNVMLKCFLMVKKPSSDDKTGVVEDDEAGRKVRIWSESDSGKTNIVSNNLFDCDIMSHEETPEGHQYDVLWTSGSSKTIVKRIPHKAIVFLDRPEEGDQHIWNSFRHYINMGDIFPEKWRDFYRNSEHDEIVEEYGDEEEDN